MAFICRKQTSSVLLASLSSSFSPMQGIKCRPADRAWVTFSPISCQIHTHAYTWATFSPIRSRIIHIHQYNTVLVSKLSFYAITTAMLCYLNSQFDTEIPTWVLTASGSPKTCLRSEWPRITHWDPQSLIIAGLNNKHKWNIHTPAAAVALSNSHLSGRFFQS